MFVTYLLQVDSTWDILRVTPSIFQSIVLRVVATLSRLDVY